MGRLLAEFFVISLLNQGRGIFSGVAKATLEVWGYAHLCMDVTEYVEQDMRTYKLDVTKHVK